MLPKLTTDAPPVLDLQWRQWAMAADDLDEFELALSLLDGVPQVIGDETVPVERARLLLMLRRPVEGLAALNEAGITWGSAEGQFSWPDAVIAACRAAAGDDDSFRWLMWAASVAATTGQAWRLTYLLAAAASQRGDLTVADQAWRKLVLEHRIFTRVSVAEFAATETALRDRSDAQAAVEALAGVAADLESLPTPVSDDCGPLLLAVERLHERGDAAGARLLLTALSQRNPRHPDVQHALARATPAQAMRRHRTKVVLAWMLAPLALLTGPLAWVLLYCARRLWHAQVTIPGLTATESNVWRAFRQVKYDAATGAARAGGHRLTKYHFVGLAGGLFLALYLISGALDLIASAVPAERVEVGPWSLLAILAIGTTTLVAGCLAGHALERQAQQRASRARSRAEERRRSALAGQCDCWGRRAMIGRFAAAYWQHHLAAVQDLSTLMSVRRQLGESATVGACPSTGAVWLAGDLGFGTSSVLLRGAGPEEPQAPERIQASGGFYL